MSIALGQRGWNLQPDGGLIGLGTSPGRIMRSVLCFGSGIGIADSNATVYGWRGFSNNSCVSATSTSFPRYITATRSQMCRTVLRSWEMYKYVRPNFA